MVPWLEPKQINEVALLADDLLEGLLGPTPPPARQRSSIYAALAERRRQCREEAGDWRALAPQPEVNRLLGRMVAILQGSAIASSDAGVRTAVDRLMLHRVDASPDLAARANALREISADAETEMERHFSARWLLALTRVHDGPASLLDVMSDFPYYDGYQELVAAEASLLTTPKQIIFGGGGPLPISGLLLASITGAQIILVDVNKAAAVRSFELIDALVQKGFIHRGQIEVRHQDLVNVSLEASCDGIIVASLVDAETKIHLARRLSQCSDAPPLILRSAIGLCARLAYRAAPRASVTSTGLRYRGELVPQNHVVKGLDPDVADRFDVRSDQASDILGVLSSSVLNSAELYTA